MQFVCATDRLRHDTTHDEYPLNVGKAAELVRLGVPLVELAVVLTALDMLELDSSDGDGVCAHTKDANSKNCRKIANDGDIVELVELVPVARYKQRQTES